MNSWMHTKESPDHFSQLETKQDLLGQDRGMDEQKKSAGEARLVFTFTTKERDGHFNSHGSPYEKREWEGEFHAP